MAREHPLDLDFGLSFEAVIALYRAGLRWGNAWSIMTAEYPLLGLPPRSGLLARSNSNHDEANAANQCKRAQDRRDRNRLFLLMGDLDRAQINILLFVGEAESADSEPGDSDDD